MARYELVEGTSAKFWEIALAGPSFTVRFGRIGTAGQEQTKTYGTDALALVEHDKLVREKTKKGYSLVGGAPAPAPAAPAPKSAAAPEPPLAASAEAPPPPRPPRPPPPRPPPETAG